MTRQFGEADAEIPGSDGPAVLTVIFFVSGGGGGIDANLQRWAGQMEMDPGTEAVRDNIDPLARRVGTESMRMCHPANSR